MRDIKQLLTDESPLIMTITSVCLFTAAMVTAVRSSKDADRRLAEIEPDLPDSKKHVLLLKARAAVPAYAAAGGLYLMGIAAIAGSYQTQKKRYVAMGSLYLAAQQGLEQWRNAVKDEVTAKQYDKIEHDIDREVVEKNPVPHKLRGLVEGKLFYCKFTDRYFTAPSLDFVRKAVHLTNTEMMAEGYASLNDMYYNLGTKSIPYGGLVGWTLDNGPITVDIRAIIDETDDTTVYVLGFDLEPKHNFERFL